MIWVFQENCGHLAPVIQANKRRYMGEGLLWKRQAVGAAWKSAPYQFEAATTQFQTCRKDAFRTGHLANEHVLHDALQLWTYSALQPGGGLAHARVVETHALQRVGGVWR